MDGCLDNVRPLPRANRKAAQAVVTKLDSELSKKAENATPVKGDAYSWDADFRSRTTSELGPSQPS